MVKTSVTVPRRDLEAARRLGINVSQLAREALHERLADVYLEKGIAEYAAAFADWDEREWDHLAGNGLRHEEAE